MTLENPEIVEERPSELVQLISDAPLILTGGSMYERMRRDPRVVCDPEIAHAALIYDDASRSTLAEAHREYMAVGQRHRLPMLVTASTWRANQSRLSRSKFRGQRVNQENIAFARELAESDASPRWPRHVMGVLGPAGDAYEAGEAPGEEGAQRFHAPQVDALADGAPDLIMAATLPALPEATGIAHLLAATGLPYVLSFVVRDSGTLLDGTPLGEAVDRVDQGTSRPPVAYMVNCVHPQVLESCLEAAGASLPRPVLGLRANTSTLRPEQLNDAEKLITQAPEVLADHMARVRRRFGLKIVGGCCGTGAEHIEHIAARCKETT
jgi:homocysteine S-methyltransferase